MDSRPDDKGGTIAIAGAIPMEVAGLRRLGNFRLTRTDGTEYMKGDVHGKDAALFVSGMGDERAYLTAKAACRALPIRAYISIGLSGSLSPTLRPGDVVVGSRIKTLASKGHSEYRSGAALIELASTAFKDGGCPASGTLLASDRVITSAGEKSKLAQVYECLATDMESAGAARAAKKAGVPFIAIRAISDGFDEDMPADFNRFTVDGAMDWTRLVWHIITHPRTISPLMRLGRNSRLAVTNLTAAVERVVDRL